MTGVWFYDYEQRIYLIACNSLRKKTWQWTLFFDLGGCVVFVVVFLGLFFLC